MWLVPIEDELSNSATWTHMYMLLAVGGCLLLATDDITVIAF